MTRIVLGGLAAALLLLLPATAQGDSSARIRGAISSKNAAAHVVGLRSSRQAVALRVPGSLAAIRVGQRVELRGSTLRSRTRGARVLARNVTILSSHATTTTTSASDDDEVEITGTLTSLSPLTVTSSTRTVSCTAPAGMSLSGFAVGEVVEMTCDLAGGTWVLRKIEHEDDDEQADADDHGGNSGPGADDDGDDDDDHSGPGGGDDDGDDDHGGHSGPGGGDDD
jgi:hypothetical protein